MIIPPNAYIAKWLEHRKYSLVDDKGEVKALPIDGTLRLTVDYLRVYDNGVIEAIHEDKSYVFKADLTPIPLPIKGKQVFAFDWVHIYSNGMIAAQYEDEHYVFRADSAPIA